MPQEAQERSSDAPEANSGTPVPPDEERAAESNSNPDLFDRAYVEELRAEAKENRLAAARADYLNTEVRRLAIREATRGLLTDPEALPWSDDYTEDETGLPDHDRLLAAAQALARAKPWLSRPRGDVGQGQHSDAPAGISLSELLRS